MSVFSEVYEEIMFDAFGFTMEYGLSDTENNLINQNNLFHSFTRVVVVGQTVGSISSRTLAYDCLCALELCTASMIATS